MPTNTTAIIGDLLDFTHDPLESADGSTAKAHRYIADGMLVIERGHIIAHGKRADLQVNLPSDAHIVEHRNKLIVPGFIDTHIHYPQCEVISSYGTQLLEWLEKYTFPTEKKFADSQFARATASFFIDELLRAGTTTALVFGTVHPASVDEFFKQAQERKLRMICGKVMMDRHAPDELLDTADSSLRDTQMLIDRWHGVDRLRYAVTPRFAPTSSEQQLAAAGKLLKANSGVHFHTHIAENPDECAWVNKLFPQHQHYLDVYDYHDLVTDRSVFAHGIHLSECEWGRLANCQSSIAHCPTSNLFIGSGLFPMTQADKHGVNVGLGTDVGGGDSFSILRTINEAYKIQQLQNYSLSPWRSLYFATLGGAKALALQDYIGNFDPGKEADLVVLDEQATAVLKMRSSACSSLEERLFCLMMLGDDRAVSHTYVLGEEVKRDLNPA